MLDSTFFLQGPRPESLPLWKKGLLFYPDPAVFSYLPGTTPCSNTPKIIFFFFLRLSEFIFLPFLRLPIFLFLATLLSSFFFFYPDPFLFLNHCWASFFVLGLVLQGAVKRPAPRSQSPGAPNCLRGAAPGFPCFSGADFLIFALLLDFFSSIPSSFSPVHSFSLSLRFLLTPCARLIYSFFFKRLSQYSFFFFFFSPTGFFDHAQPQTPLSFEGPPPFSF